MENPLEAEIFTWVSAPPDHPLTFTQILLENTLKIDFFFVFSAGAKLVLPTGEIPTLKPVDKNVLRPRLPPPGPPNNGHGWQTYFTFFLLSPFVLF